MTEPVLFVEPDLLGPRTVDFVVTHKRPNEYATMPLYAHPAPAPAEGCGACPDACEGGECLVKAESPPAGVPDVRGLIERLRRSVVDYTRHARPDTARIVNEAADALAALQSQLNLRIAHGWIADAAGKQQDDKITQQAERIKELKATYEEMCAILMGSLPLGMCTEGPLHALKNLVGRCAVNEAKLAEAVGLLERNASQRWPLSPSDHTIDRDTAEFLTKAREVMG